MGWLVWTTQMRLLVLLSTSRSKDACGDKVDVGVVGLAVRLKLDRNLLWLLSPVNSKEPDIVGITPSSLAKCICLCWCLLAVHVFEHRTLVPIHTQGQPHDDIDNHHVLPAPIRPSNLHCFVAQPRLPPEFIPPSVFLALTLRPQSNERFVGQHIPSAQVFHTHVTQSSSPYSSNRPQTDGRAKY